MRGISIKILEIRERRPRAARGGGMGDVQRGGRKREKFRGLVC